MQWTLAVPLLIGVATVLQATLNKTIAQTTGLAAATLLNMSVALACSLGFALVCLRRKEATGFLRWSPDFGELRLWWLIPGLVGFVIVLGLPWAVARVGALSTFVALVGAQTLASALWDRWVSDIPFTGGRVAGACFAVLAIWLLSRPTT